MLPFRYRIRIRCSVANCSQLTTSGLRNVRGCCWRVYIICKQVPEADTLQALNACARDHHRQHPSLLSMPAQQLARALRRQTTQHGSFVFRSTVSSSSSSAGAVGDVNLSNTYRLPGHSVTTPRRARAGTPLGVRTRGHSSGGSAAPGGAAHVTRCPVTLR